MAGSFGSRSLLNGLKMQQLVDNSGAVLTDTAFRAANPFTSFPAFLQQSDVESFGYNVVIAQPQPVPPNAYYMIHEGNPGLVDNVWTQTWIMNPIALTSAQATQVQILSGACAQALTSGFSSSALGSAYKYPSGLTDQLNLSSAIQASLIPGITSNWTTTFWCQSSAGVWAFVSHTAAQIQQVQNDWNTARLALQSQYAALSTQVQNANSVDAVASVVWALPSASISSTS
jgi:hypothetical protein